MLLMALKVALTSTVPHRCCGVITITLKVGQLKRLTLPNQVLSSRRPRAEEPNPVTGGEMSKSARKKMNKNLTLQGVDQATLQVIKDIHLKVLEAKGIGAKGIPIQRYSKAKGIWNNIFTSPKEP